MAQVHLSSSSSLESLSSISARTAAPKLCTDDSDTMLLFMRAIIINDGRHSLSLSFLRINLITRIWQAIPNNSPVQLCYTGARADLGLTHLHVMPPTRVGTNAICAPRVIMQRTRKMGSLLMVAEGLLLRRRKKRIPTQYSSAVAVGLRRGAKEIKESKLNSKSLGGSIKSGNCPLTIRTKEIYASHFKCEKFLLFH
jgi:hypothetical protein